MNRYTFHIASAIFFIVMPIVVLWYGYWDAAQPKVGPVGNGIKPPTFQQTLPFYGIMLMGIVSFLNAILRYREYKKSQQKSNNEEID
ncbi:hypothetical protein [Paenibacillus sp. YIM B09110]|uniref:hypothetical protein n=1 Tax=Paenibacillus sp. YIM B09110 TaxID=3126102 RepID=UPI00301E08A8